MKFLSTVIKQLPEYKRLSECLDFSPTAAAAAGLTTVHKAHIIHALCAEKGVRAFVVASDEAEAQTLANDLCSMGGKALVYPVRDFTFRDVNSQSREYEHKRLNVLSKMLRGDYTAVIVCIDAACQYTIPPQALKDATVRFRSGGQLPLEQAVRALTLNGYERCEQVEGPGQFAVRGGILDFFMPDAPSPVRAEFWGDEIDTLNYFDAETQRRTDYIEELTLTPSTELLIGDTEKLAGKIEHKASLLRGKTAAQARDTLQREADSIRNGVRPGSMDKFIGLLYDSPGSLFDYKDKKDLLFILEPVKTNERLRAYNRLFEEELQDCFSDGTLCRGFDKYQLDRVELLDILRGTRTVYLDNFTHGSYDLPLRELVTFTAKQLSSWSGSMKVLCEDLQADFHKNSRMVVLAGTRRSAQSVAQELKKQGFPAQLDDNPSELSPGKIYVLEGCLSSGFEYPSLHFSVITHGQIVAAQKRKKAKNKNAQQVYSLSELSPGDYVVHTTHGIGVFGGIQKLDMQGVVKDYIRVEYAKKDVLYVPVTQLDLISKYIGPRENSAVRLSRLGGSDWQKAKARVKSAVRDMAKELAALYAQRMQAQGYAFPPDGDWQRDFEARFEYEETEDQIRCIDEIKADMERTTPMDRLLCGDVGFGKTEVALRAAFKCVTDSKQCALLCPTTILAWQHYQTVLRRFEGYPVRVELLSRFRTPKQQQDIIRRLKRGEIDMVVGTHRLVQKDVVFHDLGLCIIDEEQRFGVAQKERFKEICKNVDVLTLSATPIPRTLNMAMSGIRDMSVLEEAPQDRHPVQTYVLEHDDGVICEAIRRELRRGGQVFYLHNKVETIERRAAKLAALVPEAKIAVGHGKMNEQELSEVWRKMIEQEVNILVCTTIIETGVDLPNANTLIIENADCMGLSQLHQLRGRVGRSSRRAYAYFTFVPNKVLSEISQKRLTAIREFTQFGSGFKIAMRDLELRGAGNILGAQQHGHMEDVGYDMYLKLLGEAVKEEKGEPVEDMDLECLVDVRVQAHIPEEYIESLSQRLDIYRRISDIRSREDAHDVTDELIDRFGDPPKSVLGLIDVALVRNAAAQMGIYEIKQQNDTFLLYVRQIKSQGVADIIGRLKGKAMLSAGSKPYIAVKMGKDTPALNALHQIFDLK